MACLPLFIAGCVCRKEKIQCWFSASVSFDQRLHFPLICFRTHYFECCSTPEISWYYCLHSCLHAYWLGNAFGKCHSFVSQTLSFILYEVLSLHPGLIISDCSSFEALDSTCWFLGIGQDTCPRLWNCNGVALVHTNCILGLVPICFGVPNPNVVQPSIQ